MTIDARNFSPDGTHAGTDADPWPGVAIKNAIDSLNDATDTVRIANGIWRFTSQVTVNRDNFTLQGESRDGAIIDAVGAGILWFGSDGGGTRGINNCKFENLFWCGEKLTEADNHAVSRVSTPRNFTFTNCKITGHQWGSMPALFFEGGDNVTINKNLIIAGPMGAASLQLQSGPAADVGTGRRYVMTENELDSTGIVFIGIDEVQITKNVMHNKKLANSVGIMVCGKWDQTCHNIIIDGNTLDIGASNGSIITGLPNDPGGASVIDGFVISNNIIKGTGASIACQSLDSNNYNDNTLAGNIKKNVTIKGNTLHAYWGEAGINLKAGAGLVDTVLVENNTLTNDAGKENGLSKDANTRNVTVRGNTGIPNDDGTEPEPIPPEPEPPEPEPPPTKNTITIAVNADPPGGVRVVLARATPTATPVSTTGKKPLRPPTQPPTVTIAVDCQPPDTSKIVFVGNAT